MSIENLPHLIRSLRTQQQRTLKDIADRCGFTVSLLSKIESGKTSPPVATLAKIATALGTTVGDLLSGNLSSETACTRSDTLAKQALTMTDKGYGFHLLAAERSGKVMQPFLFVAERGKVKATGLSHTGEEFIYVLEGEMNYRVGAAIYRLGPGDSLYFSSTETHDLEPISDTVRYLAVFTEGTLPKGGASSK
ncbi:MAG: XRE family transcriptional regulator [Verrucomicrobiota bacterium]